MMHHINDRLVWPVLAWYCFILFNVSLAGEMGNVSLGYIVSCSTSICKHMLIHMDCSNMLPTVKYLVCSGEEFFSSYGLLSCIMYLSAEGIFLFNLYGRRCLLMPSFSPLSQATVKKFFSVSIFWISEFRKWTEFVSGSHFHIWGILFHVYMGSYTCNLK